MQKSDFYVHKKSGVVYEVIEIAQMKHPENEKWIPCVIYQNLTESKTFVREYNDFKFKFEQVVKLKNETFNTI